MGLGPPVCTKCNLLYAYESGGAVTWQCPKCKAGIEDCKANLWELPTEEQDKYIDDSSIFRVAEKRKCSLKR